MFSRFSWWLDLNLFFTEIIKYYRKIHLKITMISYIKFKQCSLSNFT